MACISTALIIGGGIAGLASSIALAKAGVQCEVVELADAPLGASIGLSGRAAETLVELGVYEQCYENGAPHLPGRDAASLSDAEGKLISPSPQRASWPGGKVGMAIYRPVLLKILFDAAVENGVKIRRGVTTKTIDFERATPHASFTDGTEGTYDLIVGTDGISSSTRRLLFPEAAKPTYSGQMTIRWMAPGPPIPGEGWFVGPLGRLGFYYLPQGLVYVPAVIDAPEGTWLEGEELYQLYVRLLDSFTAPPVVELRKRLTRDSDLICRPFDWILLPKPWYRGRALLLGDAAHATTAHMGMGGGMALEDSVVLGQCIAAVPNLEEALSSFMDRRYERVRLVVETSVALSNLEQSKAPRSESMVLFKAAFQALSQPY